ncbi:MAG: polyphosphate polymerase domain-containing protein [Bacteroides sp.]|nr:polyphosphate polymerase domain-containing protein [Bacteroides sp.]MCM1550747.1 polyphosphate polymerase domain-containing protein [Clostridium sp.]
MEEHIFKRFEIKYRLEEEQYKILRQRIDSFLKEDCYGETDICNCYYDTPDFRLIRNSIEQSVYKEKLRLRSYDVPACNEAQVFLELKKKFQGVVYKRRENLSIQEAEAYLNHGQKPDWDSQILQEIDWVLHYYGHIGPAMYIAYRRLAMLEREADMMCGGQDFDMSPNGNQNLRVTFDWDIRWRTEKVNLGAGIFGTPLLSAGQRIMEIKTPGAIPKWLTDILDELKLYPVSFSKYGKAYEQLQNKLRNENIA